MTPAPWLDDGDVRLYLGDCLDVLRELPDESIDAVVTDPPYGLEFMGRDWDRLGRPVDTRLIVDPEAAMGYQDGNGGNAFSRSRIRYGQKAEPRAQQEWHAAWAAEAFRVLKPGGHLLAFGGTRTFHRLTCGLEDAGFEIRDCLSWLYGSGFPKSLDVSKAIDKAAGAEGTYGAPKSEAHAGWIERGRMRGANGHDGWATSTDTNPEQLDRSARQYAPATPEAETWQGWGTALKPAWEPIVVARKPLAGTVARNVLAHGTGALNVDGCRIGETVETWPATRSYAPGQIQPGGNGKTTQATGAVPAGRWPANVTLDEEAAALLDEQAGPLRARGNLGPTKRRTTSPGWGSIGAGPDGPADPGDAGGPSRFFYTAKASTAERDGTKHPTVKPRDLMRWLVRLVTPPGGVVLDPFAGSGTTGLAARDEGFRAILIEREEEYARDAAHRLRQLSLLGGGA